MAPSSRPCVLVSPANMHLVNLKTCPAQTPLNSNAVHPFWLDKRLLCLPPSRPPHPPTRPISVLLVPAGRCSRSPLPPPAAHVFSPNLPVLSNLFAALPLLPRVTIDPAKRQTAKSGPAVPSTQGGKTLSKSSALHLCCRTFSFFLPFQLHPFFFSFSVLMSHIHDILSLFLSSLSCVRAENWHLFIPESRFFFQIQQQKI